MMNKSGAIKQNDLPSGWRAVELNSISEIIDSRHKTPIYSDNGLAMVRVVDIKGGLLSLKYTKLVSKDVYIDFSKNRNPEIGDLIISRVGSYGNISYVKSADKFCLGQNTALIISKLANWRFLYYQLISPNVKNQIELLVVGAVQKTISLKSIKSLKINLPPLPEQKAIAHILGKLDDKIELNRQINQTLETIAQTLFKSWFVDFDPVIDNAIKAGNPIPTPLKPQATKRKTTKSTLPKTTQTLFPNNFIFNEKLKKWIPEGWEVKNFGEVSKCFDSKRIPLSKKQRESKKPSKYPYYGATSINDYINDYIFDDTYLLLGEDGSVIKENNTPFTQYVWGKIWVNNHAHVLQGKNGVSTEHLLTFMKQQNVAPYITGAVQLKINQGNMNGIPFLFSSNEINAKFSKKINSLYIKFKSNFEETQTLTKLRDTLLPKLISGKIRM